MARVKLLSVKLNIPLGIGCRTPISEVGLKERIACSKCQSSALDDCNKVFAVEFKLSS